MATFTAAKDKHTGKIVKYKTHESMKGVIDYIYKLEKTSLELMKGFNCNPKTAFEEMMLNKMFYKKDLEDGKRRMVVHFIQGFKGEEVEPELALEIADKFLQHEIFKGFKIAYAVHTDTPNIHTHFIIDTVNQDTGKMWQSSKEQLQDLKDWNDELCKQYDLSILPKKNQKTRYKARGQIEAERSGRSWVKETELAVNTCMAVATSKEDFISRMESLGYAVVWNHRAYITFERNGHKIRNKTLDTELKEGNGVYTGKYSKEALIKRFQLNNQVKANYNNKNIENEDGEFTLDAMDVIDRLIRIAARNSRSNDYPFQELRNKTDNIQAKKDRMKENEKGQGYDWEV